MARLSLCLVLSFLCPPAWATGIPVCPDGAIFCGVDRAALGEFQQLIAPDEPGVPVIWRMAMTPDNPDWQYYREALNRYRALEDCVDSSGQYLLGPTASLESHEICHFRIAEASGGPAEMARWFFSNDIASPFPDEPALMVSHQQRAQAQSSVETTLSACMFLGFGAQATALLFGGSPVSIDVSFDPDGHVTNVEAEEC